MTCDAQCRYRFTKHTDAAKRISDATILAWTATGWDGYVGHWMTFTLDAGITDHVLYPRKIDAVRHVSDEFRNIYLKMQPGGFPLCAAEVMLNFHRQAYENGFRLVDPDAQDGGPDIIPRIGTNEIHQQISALVRGNARANRNRHRSG
jgi:hypothetical protein